MSSNAVVGADMGRMGDVYRGYRDRDRYDGLMILSFLSCFVNADRHVGGCESGSSDHLC